MFGDFSSKLVNSFNDFFDDGTVAQMLTVNHFSLSFLPLLRNGIGHQVILLGDTSGKLFTEVVQSLHNILVRVDQDHSHECFTTIFTKLRLKLFLIF